MTDIINLSHLLNYQLIYYYYNIHIENYKREGRFIDEKYLIPLAPNGLCPI
jgi:hypothetical protein